MKKSNLIMIIVSISIFVVLILGATYAYFASNTSTGNGLDMTITTDDNNIAFAATEGTLSMHVKAEDMLQSQTGNGSVLAAETVGDDNIIITLSTNTETPIACTYNVYFQWNSNQAYTKTTGASKELTLELNLNDEDSTGSEGINSFGSETQISDVVTGTTKTKIVNGAFIVGSSSNSGSQEWIPTVRFYNLNKDQSALAGAMLGGKFTIEDVECNAMVNLSDELVTQSQNSVTASGVKEYTSSQDGTPYVIKHETLQYNGETLDAGIRYEGKDPDNYVTFNDEEWRIIGSFEGSTIGLEPGKWYTKIIRNASMIKVWDYEYDEETGDESYENDWTNSTLNEYLNGEYLASLTDSHRIAQYNGTYSTWYLRGMTFAQHEIATTNDWFLTERITGGAGEREGVLRGADVTMQSAIAIMYPSDYGYAAYGEGCTREATLRNYGAMDWDTMEVLGCAGVDWLMLEVGYEWLLSPIVDSSGGAFLTYVEDGGYVYTEGVQYEYAVHPVLYLEASVQIAGGNGSKANPYKLS